MRRFLIPVVMVLAIALGACGGGGGDTSGDGGQGAPTGGGGGDTEGDDAGGAGGGGSVDACTLITPEDIQAAYGVEVGGTEAQDLGSEDTGCLYTDAQGGTLIVTSYLPTGAGSFDVYRDQGEEVAGIGDAALWVYGSTLMVLQGEAVLSIQTGSALPQSGDEAALRAATEQLGRAAVERM